MSDIDLLDSIEKTISELTKELECPSAEEPTETNTVCFSDEAVK